MRRDYDVYLVYVESERCDSCGECVKMCPADVFEMPHKAVAVRPVNCMGCRTCTALEKNPEKKIIAFVCHWCALGGVDMAGVSCLQYPPHARLIRVMCSARVSTKMMRRAFEGGAAGVLVAGCEFPTCHYIQGNYAAEARVKRTKKKLAKAGFDPEKLWNIWCSAADGPKFANTMREMVEKLRLEG